MRKGKIYSLAFLIIFLFFPSFLLSNYKIVNGPRDFYFGHISYSEVKHDGKDPQVFREGEQAGEVATLNLPLLPGDTIWTTDSRRCEIQFDNGTIIRLDLNTELKIETILAQSLSSREKMSNLLLRRGGIYVLYKKYDSRETFQIITPNSAVKLNHNTVASIQITDEGQTAVQVKRGKAWALFGPDEIHLQQKKINQLERLTISRDNQTQLETYISDLEFERWNEMMNENFLELHEGKSFLPEPILRYPKSIIYFAQKFSNLYGEWVWDNLYGYVWVPYYNKYFPWGGWSPYIYGKWREINGQLFWVPEEPWGWVPYHLGLWIWDKKLGWIWLPGSVFAPSWTSWDYFMGYYCWRPWSLLDWYFDPYSANFYSFRSYLSYQYYYQPLDPDQALPRKTLHSIRKDQLKKRDSYPMPKEIKEAYKTLIAGLEKGDKKVFASLEDTSNHLVMVKKEELNAHRVQEKAVKFGQISKKELLSIQKEALAQKPNIDPSQEAVRVFRQNKGIVEFREDSILTVDKKSQGRFAQVEERPFSFPLERRAESDRREINRERVTLFERKGEQTSAPPRSSLRFRDWNPDFQTARRMGVEITYSSRANEIFCPQMGLSSSNVSLSRMSLQQGGEFSSNSGDRSSSFSSSSRSSGGAESGKTQSEGSSGGSRGSEGKVKKD